MVLSQRWWHLPALSTLVAMFCWSGSIGSEPAALPSDEGEPTGRVSLDVARDRAKLMHEVYAATLEVMHQRYFHDARAIVPARALEDVFSEMDRQSYIAARWISVNTKPMSLHHEPKSDFEKKAASEIAGGKRAIELVEDGVYRRATAIPLTGGCISCHAGMFAETPKSPRFAGLVISIPIQP